MAGDMAREDFSGLVSGAALHKVMSGALYFLNFRLVSRTIASNGDCSRACMDEWRTP